MQRIVITGGSGFVGRALCNALAQAVPGARLVVPTRHLAHGRAVALLPNVELRACDLHDAAQLPGLLAGADAVVHLVAILHGSAAAFDALHVRLPRALAAAARAAGVRRLVHVSALGVAANAPSHYLRSKAAGEAALHAEAALPPAPGRAPLGLRILRPSVIFGADDRFVNLFAGLQRLLPVLPLAGATAQLQPVWVGDVAAALAQLLLRDDLPDGRPEGTDASPLPATGVGPVHGHPAAVWQAAGPEVLTLAQVVQQAGRMAGCRRPVLALPEAIGHLQAALMALKPGAPLITADNLRSLRVPNVADPALPGLADLGIRPAPLASLAGHLAPEQASDHFRRTRA